MIHFKEMDWSSRFEGHDINHNYNLFVETASLAIDMYIPRTSKGNKTKPFGGPKDYLLLFVLRKDHLTSGKPPRLVVTIKLMPNKEIQSNQW